MIKVIYKKEAENHSGSQVNDIEAHKKYEATNSHHGAIFIFAELSTYHDPGLVGLIQRSRTQRKSS